MEKDHNEYECMYVLRGFHRMNEYTWSPRSLFFSCPTSTLSTKLGNNQGTILLRYTYREAGLVELELSLVTLHDDIFNHVHLHFVP